MKKTVLDNFIILYSENDSLDFMTLLQNINNEQSAKNLWEFASFNNIKNTNHVVNQKTFNLPTSDNLFSFINYSVLIEEQQVIKKNNLKYALNNHIFPFLNDYLETHELSIKKIKDWTVYEQISDSNFHHDINKDGLRHSYTILVALNDDYVGGDMYFENRVGNEAIKMSKGDVLIYPSGINYKHKESQVTSGNKYAAVAYF